MLAAEGGYVHSEGDDHWWIPSGRVFFSPNMDDAPAQELDAAREHFFLPRRFRDPFGGVTTAHYDARDLLLAETRDALSNTVRSVNDYRVMQPRLITDPNGNRAAVAFDALGMVAGVAMMGKESETLGDSLDGFEPDLDDATIIAHLQNPFASPHDILNRASARMVYDLQQFLRASESGDPQPNVVYSLARETHDADLTPGQFTRIQHIFSYSDGFGREIQRKIQAEPGPLVDGEAEISPRWVGSGWTIFNNKGNPVRQYEPFFSAIHDFEFARTIGVSPILFYDPVERVVATLHPNHTWDKVVFDPWRQETSDVNDTVLQDDPRNDPDVGAFFRRLPDAEYLPTWTAQRQGGAMGAREQNAATKAVAHANTPGVAQFDTLGHPFLTVDHNRFERNGQIIDESYSTRVNLDIEGNQREVIDARDRIVMRYDYDMLGNQTHSSSMEAGERWMFNDVAGQPIRAWNNRGHVFHTEYDELRRPTRSFVAGADANDPDREILFQRAVYGEGLGDTFNHRGRVFQVFDGAGVVTNEEYDFKGNLRRSSRQLLVNYRDAADYSLNPALEAEVFTSSASYDAHNRPMILITPDGSRIHPFYNEANLLERVEAHLAGADSVTTFVSDIDYNARGQRELIEYGAGVRTTYEYDPLTFRLTRLMTLRGAEPLQDLSYTYDPVGNITDIRDDAQQTIYFNNQVVEPHAEYTYDAIYRLIEASGREHIGQVSQPQTSWNDEFRVNLPHPNDGQAMRRYTERYEYDEVGNILRLIHQATNGDWTRAYAYNEPSLIEPALINNRLSQADVGGSIEAYTHDAHGNMARMSHLPLMRWNYLDQLEATSQQVVNNGGTPETTYYVYDASGQRVRKVTERQAAAGQTPTRRNERIYLGGFEIYREYEVGGTTTALERQALHIMEDQRRVALVETRVQGDDGSPALLTRYQFGSHLGSAALELDESGNIISYEEYHPYGSASYQAGRNAVEISRKRYRYTGKERDEETGLQYHGARYYASWLARWTSADPVGVSDGMNRYAYAHNRPTVLIDSKGTLAESPPPQGGPRTPMSVSQALEKDFPQAPRDFFRDIAPGEVRVHQAPGAGGRDLVHVARNTGTLTTGASFRLLPTDVSYLAERVGDVSFAKFLSDVFSNINERKIHLVRKGFSPSQADAMIRKADTMLVGELVGALFSLLGSAATVTAVRAVSPRPSAGNRTDSPVKQQRAVTPSAAVLSDKALVNRAESLHRDLAVAALQKRGVPVTEGAIRRTFKQGTVSIVEVQVEGQVRRIVNTNNPTFQRLLDRDSAKFLLHGEQMGSRVTYVYGPTGRQQTTIHAEQLGVNDAVAMGATEGRVASSNPGCRDLCQSLLDEFFSGFRHVNPAK